MEPSRDALGAAPYGYSDDRRAHHRGLLPGERRKAGVVAGAASHRRGVGGVMSRSSGEIRTRQRAADLALLALVAYLAVLGLFFRQDGRLLRRYALHGPAAAQLPAATR